MRRSDRRVPGGGGRDVLGDATEWGGHGLPAGRIDGGVVAGCDAGLSEE